jgi:hypothetical protein
MKSFILLFLSIAILTPLTATSNTDYNLNRVLFHGRDVLNVDGIATVHDSGPFSPIEALEIDAAACQAECDPQTLNPYDVYSELQFSPMPPAIESCDCVVEALALPADSHSRDGQIYVFGDNENIREISIIRRGSAETGDPSLIIQNEDGDTFIFGENDP